MSISLTQLSEPSVLLAAFFIIFNPFLWNVIGRYEHATRRISRAVGQINGVYLVACAIFGLGLLRDALFEAAIRRSPVSEAMLSSLLLVGCGYGLMACGSCLVLTSLYKLGIVGTYLGDYFGLLFPAKIVDFPFSHFEHPMYQGATMLFLGTALAQGSPIGLFLGSLAGAVYSVAASVEGPFTAEIYAGRASKKYTNVATPTKNGRRVIKAGKQ